MIRAYAALACSVISLSVGAQACDTWSPRKGCIGGSRATNPNWSPNQGYTGGDFQPTPSPLRQHPGQFVNCDQAGCWGSANNVRYNFVAGGNLQGTDGSFCTRGAGNTFSCN